MKFLYANRGEFWFCDPQDPSKRFKIEESFLGNRGKFLKANFIVQLLTFGDRTIGIDMPIKVDLKVTDSPPAVKGDSSQGAMKQAKLESGVTINVPLFINEGDVIKVNTETGAYVERADKK